MTDPKIKPEHLRRAAFVYVRQSTPSQVEYHRESTQRQYALVERARSLGGIVNLLRYRHDHRPWKHFRRSYLTLLTYVTSRHVANDLSRRTR